MRLRIEGWTIVVQSFRNDPARRRMAPSAARARSACPPRGRAADYHRRTFLKSTPNLQILASPDSVLAAVVNTTVVADENLTVGSTVWLPAESLAPGR